MATVLDAEYVYIVMNEEYRISRNRRAEWFFSKLNGIITIHKLDEFITQKKDCSNELEVVSVIPFHPPAGWNEDNSNTFSYRVVPNTVVTFLSRNYRIVYCLDISPSVAAVDVQTGTVMFDGIFQVLKSSMNGIMREFRIPGSRIQFQPKIHITVIAHSPFLASLSEQVLVHGVVLNADTITDILRTIFSRLNTIENRIAEVTASVSEGIEKARDFSDRIMGKLFDEGDELVTSNDATSVAMTPDFGLVDCLRQALIALHLLPENSTAALIIVTDGVISVPDGGYLDMILSQLRYNTVSCSFIQLSSPFHPHLCHGVLPYADLMRFISSSTYGAFFTSLPNIRDSDPKEINCYHKAFLAWNFQKPLESMKTHSIMPLRTTNKPGEWSVRNQCFFTVRDMPIVKKQQYETTLNVDYMKVLSSRLREGFTIKEVVVCPDNKLEIKLVLPWKFLIQLEYILITPWPALPKVNCIVSLEGPYDFLHDVTCLAKKPFQSYYRQLMVTQFWASQKNLSESDKLLVHFNSFSSNPSYYNIPDSLRNGVPLFYISSNASAPVLQSSDFAYPQFEQFWRPVCLLDTRIWQKWMHTHRIGILLEHDHPLPKHLHLPNSSGRYHVIQCRQTVMALNILLKDWSSFVLVENHSYIKLMIKENEKTPFSFYIIRVTSKPPCVVLRLAFLVGTPGHLRHEAVTVLREKVADLTFPQRLREPPKWRVFNTQATSRSESSKSFKRTWSDMHCCILLHKPIEKILIRYERVPRNFFLNLLPQHPYNNLRSPKTSTIKQSTFGFRPTGPSSWSTNVKMGPEMFNTVARFLHHKRWIWCLQSTPNSPMNIEGAAFILSTITKMRLQEGFRFAYSAAGVVNMIMELDMDTTKETKEQVSTTEDMENSLYTPCVLQYVIFPPTSSLNSGTEETEEGDVDEVVEDSNELYLITECWVEPQSGRVVKNKSERTYLDNLEYSSIPTKVFELDKECIWAMATLEHLNAMCHNDNVHSPSDMNIWIDKKPKSLIPSEDPIQLVPFEFQLSRILPKSRQAEMLFSLFTQDLAFSFPVGACDELSRYCERANSILYETWISSVTLLHDREVFLTPEHNKTVLSLILNRRKNEENIKSPVGHKEHIQVAYPRWSCFIKSVSDTDVLLTLLPATLYDLKLLIINQQSQLLTELKSPKSNRAAHLVDDSEEICVEKTSLSKSGSSIVDKTLESNSNRELDVFSNQEISSPPKSLSAEPVGEIVKRGNSEIQSCATPNADFSPGKARKRLRVKSGGDSGPVSKKASRKNSGDSATRPRTCSIDTYWATRHEHQINSLRKAKDNPKSDPNLAVSLQESFKKSLLLDSKLLLTDNSVREADTLPEYHNPKYGSFTMPVSVYYCCAATLTDHLIFRSSSGKDDLEFDRRVMDDLSDSFNYFSTTPTSREGTPDRGHHGKMHSPEPKSEESELGTGSIKQKVIHQHCADLGAIFSRSYVHGLFSSLQNDFYVHSNDIKTAINICEETKVEINLSEFIKTICGHLKVRKVEENEDCSAETTAVPFLTYESCHDVKETHSFIKRRFKNAITHTFNQVKGHTGIYNYKFSAAHFNSIARSEPASNFMFAGPSQDNISSLADSKNTSDFEDVESLTVKPESVCSDLLQVLSKDEISKSPEPKVEEEPQLQILDDEFIVQTIEKTSNLESEVVVPMPLFLYLSCRYNCGEQSGSFMVNDMPTCFEDLSTHLEELQTEQDLDTLDLVMEFVFLTVPPNIDDVESMNSKSVSSSRMPSPFRGREENDPESEQDDKLNIRMYPKLPPHQLQAVKKTVEEVKWLLKDEITSFRWEVFPVPEATLSLVATHVEKSRGKQGCLLQVVPLTFVNNSYEEGYEKFKERFRKLTLDSYHLQEVGNWFYLVDTTRMCGNSPEKDKTVEQQDADDSSIYPPSQAELNEPVEDAVKATQDGKEAEETKTSAMSARNKDLPTGQDSKEFFDKLTEFSARRNSIDSQSNAVFQLATPGQLSEVSSLVESFITNEDGYEGDGSESGGEEEPSSSDFDRSKSKLPPFWMVFKLNAEHVVVYFQCRYNEDDLTVFQSATSLRERMLKMIINLRKVVNQDLLLQQLHDTRQCSAFLEPENEDSEFWDGRDVASISIASLPQQEQTQSEEFDAELWQAESNINFLPGTFSCEVAWETKFFLHSRLRTGPGKSVVSRGIQTLQTTLIAFEVVNRQNMFVYRDSSGNVFYLRLYRTQETVQRPVSTERQMSDGKSISTEESYKMGNEFAGEGDSNIFSSTSAASSLKLDAPMKDVEMKSEDVVLLQVHGITEAGPEIKEQLVQSLRNKLDDAVLDILSVTLDRNPHCKLTPEDVHFIQKPFSDPDVVFKCSVNEFAADNLNAFAYYFHQNLLQFLYIAKYMDFKSENHFQDYSRMKEGDPKMENNVYLYNQSPGGTGSRGIGCVSVALTDSLGNLISDVVWTRPSSEAYKNSNKELLNDYSKLVHTEEITAETNKTDVMVDVCLWKQGRINMDLLKNFFLTAIKHSIWDLAMEYHYLTAPVACNGFDSESQDLDTQNDLEPKRSVFRKNSLGPLSPIQHSRILTSPSSPEAKDMMGMPMERRNSAQLLPNVFFEKTSDLDYLQRPRSTSFTARRSDRPFIRSAINRAPSPQTVHSGRKTDGVREKKSITFFDSVKGDNSRLHHCYGETMKKWCTFGSTLNVPTLRIVPIRLLCRHSVDIISREVEKIIQAVAPDNEPKTFWRCKSNRENYYAKMSKSTSSEKFERQNQHDSEFKKFSKNYKKLVALEKYDEAEKHEETEYPPELLELFKTPDQFHPTDSGTECLIVSRNCIHWKACTSREDAVDALTCIPEVHKNIYKFVPLLLSGRSQDKSSRLVNTNVGGLFSLLNEPNGFLHPILIPRQRLLLASFSGSQLVFHFYNWSKESGDRLIEYAKCLGLWIDARASLLSSILLQKSGLFHKQPIMRKMAMPLGYGIESNPFMCGGVDVDVLCKNHCPPKEISSGRLTTIKRLAKPSKSTQQFLECYRNLLHASMLKIADKSWSALKTQGEHAVQIMKMDNKEMQNAVFQYWLLRGPSASNVIGSDAIETFKQAARTIHFCLTPIIFLPRWRTEVAATRDNTVGIYKKTRISTEGKKVQLSLKSDLGRSRHGSGTSQRSLEVSSKTRKGYSIWGLWSSSSTQANQENPALPQNSAVTASGIIKKSDDKWHGTLCKSLMQEYMQYLQTLGFIPIQSRNPHPQKESGARKDGDIDRVRHMSDTSVISSASSQSGESSQGFPTFGNFVRRIREDSGEKTLYYLQKSLSGGIILFEVGLSEPFFYAKIHALEATRIQGRKSRRNHTLAFLDECEKMKVLMHLHSFTYDFHLRSIHSYISGRQLIFKQGYHLTNFLDDFIKYYPKGPNFARNTVHIGLITLQNVTTPSHILYNYILSHDKFYNLKVIRMNPLQPDGLAETPNEFIMVHNSSKKVTYKMEDENQYDDFDLTLLISHDAPPFIKHYSMDPSVLRVKYYIVLTSRRELYPKVNEENNHGKFCTVNTPEALAQRVLAEVGCGEKLKSRASIDIDVETPLGSQEKKMSPGSDVVDPFAAIRYPFEGIKEEKVNFVGYFSSHEQLMQEIVNEQTVWVDGYIREIVGKASVDCRRDLLWQRLLVGGQGDEKHKNKKDLIYRETFGELTYWDFTELMELVQVRSLSKMDERLSSLLNQPFSFYVNLMRLLMLGSQKNHRYFIAPDSSTHQMAVLAPNAHQSMIVLEVNNERKWAQLNMVFKHFDDSDKEKPVVLENDVLTLIEYAVSACCFCAWTNLIN